MPSPSFILACPALLSYLHAQPFFHTYMPSPSLILACPALLSYLHAQPFFHTCMPSPSFILACPALLSYLHAQPFFHTCMPSTRFAGLHHIMLLCSNFLYEEAKWNNTYICTTFMKSHSTLIFLHGRWRPLEAVDRLGASNIQTFSISLEYCAKKPARNLETSRVLVSWK
jgi:hypothetical protein